MHFSLFALATFSAAVQCTPIANTTASTLAAREVQPWYTYSGGDVPDARSSKTAPATWNDPISPVPKGSFSVIFENGQVNVFAKAMKGATAPTVGYYATSFALCDSGNPTTTQDGSGGWVNIKATSLAYWDIFVHPGNQCSPTYKVQSEQYDNTWLRYHSITFNLPGDTRCGDVKSYLPGIMRARRCIFRI